MEFTAKIMDYIEDKGKNKDGRLVVKTTKLPNERYQEFFEWLGGEFISKGGLYAVDIVSEKGIFRVYKNPNKKEKNRWIELKEEIITKEKLQKMVKELEDEEQFLFEVGHRIKD